MSALLVALILAAIICGVMWRRPDARAVAAGAWQAGKAQAVQEFRAGYRFAQERLREGNPRRRNPRRWLSWGLSGAYGAVQTVAAANRIRRRAWQGGRARYREWQAAQPIDAEVIDDPNEPGQPEPSADDDPQPEAEPDAKPEPADEDPPKEGPDPGPEPNQQEEPEVQTEAAGLTSYANAHTELADELQSRMTGIENLAASMSGILAEHSELIGASAVMQDLLNQAAGVARQNAERALQVANN